MWWSHRRRPNQAAFDAQASCGLDNYPEDSFTEIQWQMHGVSPPTTTTPSAACSSHRSRSDCNDGSNCCWSNRRCSDHAGSACDYSGSSSSGGSDGGSSSSATDLSSTMTFDLPAAAVTAVLNNATVRAAFDAAFKTDMGAALGVPTSRITVTAVRQGSLLVDFTVTSMTDAVWADRMTGDVALPTLSSDATLTGAGVAIPASVPASSASTPSSASAPAEGVATSAGPPLHVAPAGTLATAGLAAVASAALQRC